MKYGRDGSEYKIPEELEKHPKVKILRPERDLGPITKLLPAAEYVQKKDPDSMVITVDDDIGYPPGMMNELIFHSVKNPDAAVGATGHLVGHWKLGSEKFPSHKKRQIFGDDLSGKLEFKDVLEGIDGIGYRARQIDVEFMKKLSQSTQECFVSDDLVINYALAASGVARVRINNKFYNTALRKQFAYGTEADALHKGAGLNLSSEAQMQSINAAKYQKCYQKLIEISRSNRDAVPNDKTGNDQVKSIIAALNATQDFNQKSSSAACYTAEGRKEGKDPTSSSDNPFLSDLAKNVNKNDLSRQEKPGRREYKCKKKKQVVETSYQSQLVKIQPGQSLTNRPEASLAGLSSNRHS